MALRIDPRTFSDVLAPAVFNIADAFATATAQERLAKRRQQLQEQDFARRRDLSAQEIAAAKERELGRQQFEAGQSAAQRQAAIERERIQQEGAMALLDRQIEAGRYDRAGKAGEDTVGIDANTQRAIEQARGQALEDALAAQGTLEPELDAQGQPVQTEVKAPVVRDWWFDTPGEYKPKMRRTGKTPSGEPWPAGVEFTRDDKGRVVAPEDPRAVDIVKAFERASLLKQGIHPENYRRLGPGNPYNVAPPAEGGATALTGGPVTPPTMPAGGGATTAAPVAGIDPQRIAVARQQLQQTFPGEDFSRLTDEQIVAEHRRRRQAQAQQPAQPQPATTPMSNALTIPTMPQNVGALFVR